MSQHFIDSTQVHQARELISAWGRAYAEGHPPPRLQETIAPQAGMNRGEADVQAAWQRWHDPIVDERLTDTEWPWYAVMERARVETLASRHLPGMARNLRQLEMLSPTDPTRARLYQAARHLLGGKTGPGTLILERAAETRPGTFISRGFPGSRDIWKGFRLLWQPVSVTREVTSRQASDTKLDDDAIAEALIAARRVLKDGPHFAEAVIPIVRALAGCHGPVKEDKPAQNPDYPADDAMPNGETMSDEEHPDADLERPGDGYQDPSFTNCFPDYAVLSRAWDEESPATRWYRPDDKAALQALDNLGRQRVRQLAQRLQRRLLAAQLRHWSFDQEEGRLDSRRLARLIGARPNQRIFRIEEEATVPEACVTLLVDQSGSMRGTRRQMAALAIDLAVHTLELCQVRCEVLGFTTRFSTDNPVSQRWRRSGCLGTPGRLNALRHILYKTTEQPWRRARPYLGLLLREGFGHENIDGEALHWAARRLLHKPQARKVLVVLSDGAPHDEDTVRANGREFLENHLRAVIGELESSSIQLAAIGTGQDVGRFYRHAVTVRRPEMVAEVLFERLGDLLTQPKSEKDNP